MKYLKENIKKEKVSNNEEMKNIKMRKKSKGITLIALVITIIILLILAGVSIAMLTGENGILNKSDTARKNTEVAGEKEQIVMAYNVATLEKLAGEGEVDVAKILETELKKQNLNVQIEVITGQDGTSKTKVTFPDTKNTYEVDNETGKITENGEQDTPPTQTEIINITEFSINGEDATTVPELDEFVHVGGTIEDGYVISDDSRDANKGLNPSTELFGNQFVWVPVKKNQKITAKVTTKEDITSIVITDPYGDDIVKEANKGKSYNNTEITPTINGPYRIVVTTSSGETKKAFLYVHSLYAQDTFKDFEIVEEYANKKGYDSLQKMLETLGYSDEEEYLMDGSFMKNYSEVEDYTDSVNKYGGYFVGRYEVGKETNETAVIAQKNKNIYNYISQQNALDMAKNYKPNVQSSLLTGAAWDRVLGWVYESKEKSNFEIYINSTSWGNYSNDTFSNNDGLISTGKYEETNSKNIYDIAGNIAEWTTESYNNGNKVIRGGTAIYTGSQFPASYRDHNTPPNADNRVGFRVALYIKV